MVSGRGDIDVAEVTGAARRPAGAVLKPTAGLRLLGEYQGSGFTEPVYLVRRGDGQVIQLSRLLYLVAIAITDGGDEAERVASRVAAELGRDVTADNIRYLVAGKLAPLGVVLDLSQEARPVPGRAAVVPRKSTLLGLRLRGVLLGPRAAAAVGDALAWLHYPPLVAVVLAAFAAFQVWLFAVHGAIAPLIAVLSQPVLFLAVTALMLVSMVFHEFGHASACRFGGARPGHIGFGLYLVWPSLYTDVTDAYRLSRTARLRTDLGGVYFNAVFALVMACCYAATGQPAFLAVAFLGNFEIAQQLVPVVRFDGYFILGDLAGVADLFGLLVPVMASLAPGAAARRIAAPAEGLRRGPRVAVTAWVLASVPVLAVIGGYTLWHLPAMVVTAVHSFSAGLGAAKAAFAAGHLAAGLAGGLTVVFLLLPAAGLAYLFARITFAGLTTAGHWVGSLLPWPERRSRKKKLAISPRRAQRARIAHPPNPR
jgi:putative peptide zinc metalloprotease protein